MSLLPISHHQQDQQADHAVVVVGIDEKSIYLNDPHFADAPQSVSIPEFDLAWFEMEEYYALIKLKRGLFGSLFARSS